MKISELKKLVKECIKESIQEDELISKIIIESFRASKTLSENTIEKEQAVSPPERRIQSPKQNKTNDIRDVWKKVIEAKKPSKSDIGDYDFENIDIETHRPQTNFRQEEKPLTFSDLINEEVHEEKLEIKEDKEFINFFAKKFKK